MKKKAKNPKHVRAGKKRWLNFSRKDMLKHLKMIGETGGKATAEKWRKLQEGI